MSQQPNEPPPPTGPAPWGAPPLQPQQQQAQAPAAGSPTAPPPAAPPTQAPPTAAPSTQARRPRSDGPATRPRRLRGAWIGVLLSSFVLILLLIFIVQNDASVDINFLGASGTLPLGVALLLAAICGVLLVAIPAASRSLQRRRAARRQARKAS